MRVVVFFVIIGLAFVSLFVFDIFLLNDNATHQLHPGHALPAGFRPPLPPGPTSVEPHPVTSAETSPEKTYSAAEIQSDEQLKALCARADRILPGLKKASALLHIEFTGPVKFQPDKARKVASKSDPPLFELSSPDYSFRFQKPEDNYIRYRNTPAYSAVAGSDDLPHSPIVFDKPKWSEDQAIRVATALLKLFADTSDLKLGPPEAKFGLPILEGIQCKSPVWMITWIRVDGKGRRFEPDGARLFISEKLGVVTASVRLDDTYVEEKGKPMSSDAAIAIAKKSQPALFEASAVKSNELMIVEAGLKPERKCRLAWVIELQSATESSFVKVDALSGAIIEF